MDKPNPSPVPTPLQTALERYKAASKCLDHPQTPISPEQALEILAARDGLQKQLKAEAEVPVDMWATLIEQDARLKQKAYKITQVLNLAQYRDTLPIADRAWWWSLENGESLHPANRFDWLFRAFRLVLLGVNFTLIGTIATRFFGGGSGLVEIGGFVFSTFITLLQAENALTRARSKAFVKLMNFFKIREHWYEGVQFITTLIICGMLLGVWVNFPFFSEQYNQQGKQLQSPPAESQKLPNLALAEKKYLKAIELDEDNLDAYYKLGTLYEELQDLDSAKKQYIIAAKGGYLDAYNNLSYLYIRENKDIEAEMLLERGLVLLEQKNEQLEKLDEEEKVNLKIQTYHINKNLGWTKFKQKRYGEAISNLLVAIGVAKEPNYQKHIRNPGAGYCIYAQVLQKQDKRLEAKQSWQQCRQLLELRPSESRNIEEEQWLSEAEKQLQ